MSEKETIAAAMKFEARFHGGGGFATSRRQITQELSSGIYIHVHSVSIIWACIRNTPLDLHCKAHTQPAAIPPLLHHTQVPLYCGWHSPLLLISTLICSTMSKKISLRLYLMPSRRHPTAPVTDNVALAAAAASLAFFAWFQCRGVSRESITENKAINI